MKQMQIFVLQVLLKTCLSWCSQDLEPSDIPVTIETN